VQHAIIDLELTNACPADCAMCPRDALPKLGVMTEAVFERVHAQLAATSTLQHISLCGIGEPLLHPRFVEWVERLIALPSRPVVGLVTAGEKLTPVMHADLVRIGLPLIEISVQAVDRELYGKLMPGLDFDRVMANIEHLAANPAPNQRVMLSYVEHALNREHTKDMFEFAAARGLRMSRSYIHSRAGNLVRADLLVGSRTAPAAMRCNIYEKIAFIAWTGKVQLCCHDIRRAHVVGDLAIDELDEVLARKVQTIAEHGGPSAPICASCNDPLRTTL
jgi:uncharacterized Fe-S cluster-containing radical SAM superfamily enzyme